MNTVGPQAQVPSQPSICIHGTGAAVYCSYCDKPTERAPLLSDKDIYWKYDRYGRMVANNVRDFYEAKITSGELRVVKKANGFRPHPCAGLSCEHCHESLKLYPNFCPGCGTQIVKP